MTIVANGRTTGTTPYHRNVSQPSDSRKYRLVLVVLLSAWFMAQFDFFVVNVAAPSFERELHAGPAALELIVGGYAFTYAAGMITGGRLGDLFGHRRLFLAGMVAFTVASLLCGLAQDPTQLVLGRLAQGLTGALMVPQVLALITADFPVRLRGWAIGWYGTAGGLGSIAGQVLGGFLLDANVLGLGWRTIFLVNVPVGIIALAFAWRVLPRREAARRVRLDLLGATGIAAALGLALIPLALGRDQGWPAWVWICFALAVPAAAGTLWWQRKLAASGGQPVLELGLFRLRSFVAGVGSSGAFMLYFGSFMFTLTLVLQSGIGLTAFQAGLAFAPMGITYSVASVLGSRIPPRYGRQTVVAGGTLVAASLVFLFFLLGSTHVRLGWFVVMLAIAGVGNGLTAPRLIGATLVEVEPRNAGAGAGILTTTQQFASSAGVAVVGTVFFAAAAQSSLAGGMRYAAVIQLALVLVVITLMMIQGRQKSNAMGRSRSLKSPEEDVPRSSSRSSRSNSGSR
ncbi:MFS transporter [Fodinicola feengrottensis]|uniref:MFS transporter n=1 Tax=Fodinicola feengrottensis TaxID=435914 RepID=A0ABP4TX59_9ACTN